MFSLGEQTARIPDVAVLLGRKVTCLPDEDVPIPFAPDLAVKVVSVSETAADAEKKVGEYLAAGVREVWQVFSQFPVGAGAPPSRLLKKSSGL